MNRRTLQKRWSPTIVVMLTLVWMAGCDAYLPGPSYTDIENQPERFRQIDPLELEETESQEVEAPDANEAPPEMLDISLEQCRAFALEGSLELKALLINPTIAAERLTEEEAKFQAAFYANVNYNKSDRPSVGFSDEITGSKSDYLGSNLGVQMPLRTGGTVTLDLADAQVTTDAIGTRFNPYYTSGLAASISQPLLRNAGKWVNTHSIRVVAYDRYISDARTRLDVINILATLDRVYWRLYAARRELEVRKQQYDLAQAQLEQVRRFVTAGERPQVEVVRAEAGTAQQLGAIITAENALRDRERDLKRVMSKAGLDMQTPTILVPTTEPDPVLYELDRVRLVGTAIAGRMELLELELQLLKDASNIDLARNQKLPLATLGYTYNINGLGAARNDSFDMLFDNAFGDHRLGVQVVVPIGNAVAKSRLRSAIYQRRMRLATRASRKASIELEVLNAVDQVEANWQRILAARQNSLLNGRLFEAEERQFTLGMRTSTDVLDAQTKFADAQSAEISALAEYQIALVDLAYATGTILGAARVELEPIVPAANAN